VLLSVALAAAAYLAVFGLLVLALRVPEAFQLLERMKRMLLPGAMKGV
jgi:hypothetical protein